MHHHEQFENQQPYFPIGTSYQNNPNPVVMNPVHGYYPPTAAVSHFQQNLPLHQIGGAYSQHNNYSGQYNPTNFTAQQTNSALFTNPLQPNNSSFFQQPNISGQQSVNQYPQNQILMNQQGGFNTILNSFKNKDGTIDFNKMINTAGNMVNTVNQVSAVIKGVTTMFTK